MWECTCYERPDMEWNIVNVLECNTRWMWLMTEKDPFYEDQTNIKDK